MGNLQEKPKKKAGLSGQQLIGFGMIAVMLIIVLIGALKNFGR